MRNIWQELEELGITYEHRMRWYVIAGFRWLILSIVVGLVCGLVGYAFSASVEYATETRIANSWLIYLLPVAGLITVFLYRTFKVSGKGTDDIIEAAREGEKLPILLVPAIFIGTVLTHLTGGSAGREGAALQIGGDLANAVGRLFRLDERQLGLMTRIGMAAFFAALFGTPVAACAFGTMVINVGTISYMVIFPGLIASIIASQLSVYLGATPVRYTFKAPAFDNVLCFKVMLLALACALVSVLFIKVLGIARYLFKRYIRNAYIRVLIGAVLIIILTKLVGTTDYNGAGMDVIARALKGHAAPGAFLLKILFTAITLETGFKGGEVVPSFFIGATFGCVFSRVLGIPASLGAAIGMVGVFGGATNSFLSPVFLAMEVFGGTGLAYFAMGCIICYLFSGYSGLYSSQRIVYSKINSQRIDATPNKYHTGDRSRK